MAPPKTKPRDGTARSEENSSGTGCELLPERCSRLVLIRRQCRLIGCVLRFGSLISQVGVFRFHLWAVMSQNPSLCKFRKKAIRATLDRLDKAGAVDGNSQHALASFFRSLFLIRGAEFQQLIDEKASIKQNLQGALVSFGLR